MERPETGAMAFGNDWPGVFIRGDSAFGYARSLQLALENFDNPIHAAVLRGLLSDLDSCFAASGTDVQRMRPFEEAKA